MPGYPIHGLACAVLHGELLVPMHPNLRQSLQGYLEDANSRYWSTCLHGEAEH